MSCSCNISTIIQGQWYSYEENKPVYTTINADTMSNRGRCVDMKEEHHVNYTFVFHSDKNHCYYCVKMLIRTVNILEKIESRYFYNEKVIYY